MDSNQNEATGRNPETKETTEEKLLKKQDLADFFQITDRTVDDWMKNGIIPYFKIGRSVRFRRRDVLQHLQRHHQIG